MLWKLGLLDCFLCSSVIVAEFVQFTLDKCLAFWAVINLEFVWRCVGSRYFLSIVPYCKMNTHIDYLGNEVQRVPANYLALHFYLLFFLFACFFPSSYHWTKVRGAQKYCWHSLGKGRIMSIVNVSSRSYSNLEHSMWQVTCLTIWPSNTLGCSLL